MIMKMKMILLFNISSKPSKPAQSQPLSQPSSQVQQTPTNSNNNNNNNNDDDDADMFSQKPSTKPKSTAKNNIWDEEDEDGDDIFSNKNSKITIGKASKKSDDSTFNDKEPIAQQPLQSPQPPQSQSNINVKKEEPRGEISKIGIAIDVSKLKPQSNPLTMKAIKGVKEESSPIQAQEGSSQSASKEATTPIFVPTTKETPKTKEKINI